ncbi:MAG: 23S rRNA (pseudouridine(1915)-N(3))-methyltransferase RlmH [Clostridia bacterium]|jgi:23S rRNA (pseudouridine1915-N3)-methyltransferase|nr:23S rRNA (pseudouridine(1915)-N(3))-methyltransferase RlmH [Clostridia bacterium]
MKIKLISVGKIKEKFYREAISEFEKRLTRYCKLEIVEVADEKTPDNASDKEEEIIKSKEAEKISKHIKDGTYIVALCIEGKQLSSEEFASTISKLGNEGKSDITFIIGGSLGIHDSIKNKANLKLSFSKMTFPHQMFKVVLLEQIYRSFRITANEPYHK